MVINIDFLANVRRFLSGTKDMEGALDDVAGSLDDMATDGDRAQADLSRSFRDITRDAKRAGDDIGDAGTKGFDQVRDGARSFKEEAIQNFSEFASSAKGDMQDVVDGVQGLTGGLASSLPPLVGIPIAVGGAIAAAALQTAATTAESQKVIVEDAFQAMKDAGSAILESGFFEAAAERILTSTDETNTRLRTAAQETADSIGVPYATVIAALSGVPAAQREVNEQIAANYDAFEQKSQDINAKVASDATGTLTAFDQIAGAIRGGNDALDAAKSQYDTFSQIQRDLQTDSTNTASGIDGITSAFDRLPKKVDITVGVQVPDVDAIRRDMQARFTAGGQRLTIPADVVDRYGQTINVGRG